jgi:hypothetical protein
VWVDHAGTILNPDHPGAQDLLHKVCRFQRQEAGLATEANGLLARFADPYTMVNASMCPGCLVAEGFRMDFGE